MNKNKRTKFSIYYPLLLLGFCLGFSNNVSAQYHNQISIDNSLSLYVLGEKATNPKVTYEPGIYYNFNDYISLGATMRLRNNFSDSLNCEYNGVDVDVSPVFGLGTKIKLLKNNKLSPYIVCNLSSFILEIWDYNEDLSDKAIIYEGYGGVGLHFQPEIDAFAPYFKLGIFTQFGFEYNFDNLYFDNGFMDNVYDQTNLFNTFRLNFGLSFSFLKSKS